MNPKDAVIPDSVLQQHIVALGKTGSGKSSAMRVLVERLLDLQAPVTIIDPKGDWWGIKASADGRKPGYPVVIFGGEHADVPLNPRAGVAVAELIATGNRPSLIDLGGWMVGERTRFFIDFASTLFRHTKGLRYLVIDEVHNFAPQGKILDPDAGKMLHWANRLASEGRGKGVTIIAASQRPQKVHKDFLTSCETLIAMRVIHKLDRDAIKDWIDGCADPQLGKEVLTTLAGMKRGEAWVWSPEIEFGPERVKFPMFQTYDSFKPQAGMASTKLKGWADVDLVEIRTKLDAVVKEAEANDPAALRKRIAELEKQLKGKKAPAPAQPDSKALLAAEHRGRVRGWQEARAAVQTAFRVAQGQKAPMLQVSYHAPAPVSEKTKDALVRMGVAAVQTVRKRAGNGSGEISLPPGERAVLAAAIQFQDGLKREQLNVLIGYKRSSRDAYIQRLREKGLIELAGELVRATQEGIEALPDAEPLPTGAALQEFWFARLPPGEAKILKELVEHHPEAVSREQLSEVTGFARSSRDAYLQRLAARELVKREGSAMVSAADTLFS